MGPRFSLIIPSRNRSRTLRENLCRFASGGEEVEQIVIDNASTDGSAEMVAREFPHVRLIRLTHNRSTAARNIGAREAQAPILVMLDDDSFPAAGALDRIGRVMEEHPELSCVAARVCRTAPPGVHEGGGLPGVFIGCGAAIRRDVFLEVGGYPEDYGYYVDENVFCVRCLRAGWGVRWYEDIVV